MQIISIIATCLTLIIGHVLAQNSHYAGSINHTGYKDRFRTRPTDTTSQTAQSSANLDSRFDAGLVGTQRPPSGSYVVVQPDDINIAQNQITNSNNLPNINQQRQQQNGGVGFIGPAVIRNPNTQFNQGNNEISNPNALSGGFGGGQGSGGQGFSSQGFGGQGSGGQGFGGPNALSGGFGGGQGSAGQGFSSQGFGGQGSGGQGSGGQGFSGQGFGGQGFGGQGFGGQGFGGQGFGGQSFGGQRLNNFHPHYPNHGHHHGFGNYVKFLREVTPYFRKASIISEVGWELQRAFLCPLGGPTSPPAPRSPPRADTRYIPLQLTHLARNLKYIDPENRCIELHSPDGIHSCILRATDSQEALIWFNALHSAMANSTQRALNDANRALVNIIGELKHIGWLSRRIGGSDQSGRSSSESSEENEKWQPVFVAITEREFRIYESAPWSVEAWGRPLESCPLASTRLAGAGNNSSLNGQQTTVFCVRCGTTRGVLVYCLRSETHRDMAAWARALVQGSHNAVNYQREFLFRCLYQGRPCQLVVHLNRGFSLLESGSGYNNPPKTLLQFSFDKLKGSADDGNRMLFLDFGDDGEVELDMECCPKPVVFVLHNCLSAKVHSMA